MGRTAARLGKGVFWAAVFAAGLSAAGVATGVGPLCSDSLLCISKDHSPEVVTSGAGAITYTVAVSNANTGTSGGTPNRQQDFSGVTVFDRLGAGQTLQSLDPACHPSDPIACAAGGLGPGDSAAFTIVAGPVTTGVVENEAWAEGDVCGDGCIDTTPTVQDSVVVLAPPANLVVDKTDSPDPVATGGRLTYTIVVSNAGESTAPDVQLTDDLPAGVLDAGNAATRGACSAPPADPVVCDLGDIGPGDSVTVTIDAKAPPTPGSITNTATAVCREGGGGTARRAREGCEASDTEETTVQAPPPPPTTTATEPQRSADVGVTKSASASRVNVGQRLTYTLKATNRGPETATGVVVTDQLPAGAALISASPSKGSCSGTATVSCVLDSLVIEEGATIDIVVSFAEPGEYINAAAITSAQADPDTSNQSASAETLVLPGSESPGANLEPTTAVTGHSGYSADGLGENGAGGSLRANVPAGSSVQRAYLYGSYFEAEPSAVDRTIDLDGTSVLLTKLGTASGFLTSARADVTDQVTAKVGSGGAVTAFRIGNDPPTMDGLALLVIYANPALPETTIAVVDGAAAPAGNTVSLQFPTSIDPSAPGFSATMTLGIGHSTQGSFGHVCGTGVAKSTIVRINDHLLTSCGGGYDDGVSNRGGRITVGGVGDGLDNPVDPQQKPADGAQPRVQDDELYNLAPLLTKGDTTLEITSANPSQNDLFFLDVIAVTGTAQVLTPKLGKTFVVGTVDGSVTYRTPSSKTFVPLAASKELPINTEYDTTHGVLQLTSATGTATAAASGAAPKTETARFYDGRFFARQAKARNAVTELLLSGGSFASCPRSTRSRSRSPAAAKPVRKVWGKGKGHFRTRGRYSAGSVRGTWWLTEDRCDGTRTVVRQGVVAVQDFGKNKTVLVKAGHSYLAKR